MEKVDKRNWQAIEYHEFKHGLNRARRKTKRRQWERKMSIKEWRKHKPTVHVVPRVGNTHEYAYDLRERICNTLPPTTLKVLNKIIAYTQHYPRTAQPSILRIAMELGVHRTRVERALQMLRNDGWISTYYRATQTSLYNVADVFADPIVRWVLKDLLPELRNIHLVMLAALTIMGFSPVKGHNNGAGINNLTTTCKSRKSRKSKSVCESRVDFESTFGVEGVSLAKEDREWVKKMERSMDGNATIVPEAKMGLPVAAQNMKNLTFNLSGLVKMSVFPEAAINFIDNNIVKRSKVPNPFNLLRKMAKDYCAQHNLKIEWRRLYELEQVYGTFGQQATAEYKIVPPIVINNNNNNLLERDRIRREKWHSDRGYTFEEDRSREDEYNRFEELKDEALLTSMRRIGFKPDFNPFVGERISFAQAVGLQKNEQPAVDIIREDTPQMGRGGVDLAIEAYHLYDDDIIWEEVY